jgi:hypothetical protein
LFSFNAEQKEEAFDAISCHEEKTSFGNKDCLHTIRGNELTVQFQARQSLINPGQIRIEQ